MKCIIISLILGLFLLSCRAKKQPNKDQVIANQEQKIKELEQQIEEKNIEQDPRDSRNPNYDVYKDPDLVQIDLGKYVFAVFKTEKQVTEKSEFSNGMPTTVQKTIQVTKVSDIHKIEYYNDDKKQQFMDLVRKRASMEAYWKPKVYSLDIREFSSYSEASKAREKINYDGEVSIVLPHKF
jgi:hypothetical protein